MFRFNSVCTLEHASLKRPLECVGSGLEVKQQEKPAFLCWKLGCIVTSIFCIYIYKYTVDTFLSSYLSTRLQYRNPNKKHHFVFFCSDELGCVFFVANFDPEMIKHCDSDLFHCDVEPFQHWAISTDQEWAIPLRGAFFCKGQCFHVGVRILQISIRNLRANKILLFSVISKAELTRYPQHFLKANWKQNSDIETIRNDAWWFNHV